ncbi:DUF1949 domain-containing protein [Curtobacterium flaccumfaciens pv. flaccumfaciens]|uniref:DUF1949 domain-containing protein n=1 Tax=Curtobacterium flaccumfaciens TaxID=2035 RepID=UPI0039936598
MTQVRFDVDHADAGRLDNVLRDWVRHHHATLGPTDYGQAATFEVWVPHEALGALTADLAAASAGSLEPVIGEERIVDVRAG